ncbi:MAG TPA: hypothetical protein VEH51_12870 [Burkholderiales bacterium]|nr:hypothetical protein [Burkholderiales bacterium]
MRALLTTVMLLGAAPALAAYDVNGITLGASEREVKQAFPSVYCQPLEWKSAAAERRCDDSRISLGGAPARVTFYMKHDKVQAFDVGFDPRDQERVVAFLKTQYGKLSSERTDTITRPGKADRKIYKAAWRDGDVSAQVTVHFGTRYARLEVARDDFARKIYEVN